MTREESKEFLIDISYKLGTMGIEYLSEKDGEKMRDAIETLDQENIVVELLEKTYSDFCNSEGGESWLKIDGKEYYSIDVGYAIEGLDIFMEVFKRRLAESEGNEFDKRK